MHRHSELDQRERRGRGEMRGAGCGSRLCFSLGACAGVPCLYQREERKGERRGAEGVGGRGWDSHKALVPSYVPYSYS